MVDLGVVEFLTQSLPSQVENVALWVGLIGSVVGIVLSIVAIAFAWAVNKRSDHVSDHTIQALQKIESSVNTLSDNTNTLIKGAWDKMLGSVGPGSATLEPNAMKELAAGVAAEIEAGLTKRGDKEAIADGGGDRLSHIEQAISRLEETIATRAGTSKLTTSTGRRLDFIVQKLQDLSPEARELLYAIRFLHLTVEQYEYLANTSPLRSAIAELRDSGLLAPHKGHEGRRQVLVYFLVHGLKRTIASAMLLLPAIPESVQALVEAELASVEYRGEDLPSSQSES